MAALTERALEVHTVDNPPDPQATVWAYLRGLEQSPTDSSPAPLPLVSHNPFHVGKRSHSLSSELLRPRREPTNTAPAIEPSRPSRPPKVPTSEVADRAQSLRTLVLAFRSSGFLP